MRRIYQKDSLQFAHYAKIESYLFHEKDDVREIILYFHKYVKNRKVEIDNTSYSHMTSWQSQSLRNRSPDRVEVSSGINNTQAFASKELGGEGFIKPILLLWMALLNVVPY